MGKENQAACFFSSGKDSCLALYKVVQQGYKVRFLLNFISQEYKRVSFHGARSDLVKLQAEVLGIPLLQKETTKDNYEKVFRELLAELKGNNINQVVRGDIHLEDLKYWVKNICGEQNINVVFPLWKKPTKELLIEFIECGFKAVITSVQADKLSKDWVGRTIDRKIVSELEGLGNVDLCGEKGEYHTFVYDGPIFDSRINITKTDKVLINGFWFLDIQEYKVKSKGEVKE